MAKEDKKWFAEQGAERATPGASAASAASTASTARAAPVTPAAAPRAARATPAAAAVVAAVPAAPVTEQRALQPANGQESERRGSAVGKRSRGQVWGAVCVVWCVTLFLYV